MKIGIKRARALLLSTLLLPVTALHANDADAALALQKRIVSFDQHVDIPFDFGQGEQDPAGDGPNQFTFAKAERGGLKGAVVAIFVPQAPRTPEAYAETAAKAQQKLKLLQDVVANNPKRVGFARSPAELEQLQAEGRFSIVLSILNAQFIGQDIDQLDAWAKQGVQVVGFNHNGNNQLSDSSRPHLLRGDRLGEHGGLSELGKQAVTRLNDLGVLIDVSQITGDSLKQILALTRAPVVATHSNARAIIDHPRNLSDDQLLAIKANGGVVSINAYSSWVRPLPADAVAKLAAIRTRYGVPVESVMSGVQPISDKGVKVLDAETFATYSKEYHAVTGAPEHRATLREFVDQLEHVVKKIGIDHVGISSDFNHGGGVIGWGDMSESANVTAELLRRGYSEADIEKLWSKNFLRVWAAAQAKARQ